MTKKKEIIKLTDIFKDYQTAADIVTNVLKGISITVDQGDFIAITGPSGSGKSTLMNIIGLLDIPTKGTYILNGTNTTNFNEDELSYLRNREIGFVFQSFNLLSRASTLENVILPSIYAGMNEDKRIARAKELLTKLGLEERMGNRPNQLSGGQQQLVGIARAVVANPRIILADEPTGNLHSAQGKEIMEMFKRLNDEGTTIVQVTHSETNAGYGNRIIRLEDGWIVNN